MGPASLVGGVIIPDVEPGSMQVTVTQSAKKRGLVDDRATADVNQDSVGRQGSQLGFSDQPLRLVRVRQTDEQGVGAGE